MQVFRSKDGKTQVEIDSDGRLYTRAILRAGALGPRILRPDWKVQRKGAVSAEERAKIERELGSVEAGVKAGMRSGGA